MYRDYLAIIILVFSTSKMMAQAPELKLDLPGIPALPSSQNNPAPTPITIQPVSNQSDSIKGGSTVRVRQNTTVRSGPNDYAYACGMLPANSTVTLAGLPSQGTEYSAISAPDNCYSLVPENALYILYRPKNFKDAPQPIRYTVETLIDGEPGSGEYVGSRYKLQKGSPVWVVNEKKIMVQGKLRNYCVIRTGSKEIRYVRTADLEGVQEAANARQAQPSMPSSPLTPYQSPTSPNNIYIPQGSTFQPPPSTPVQQAVLESEQLPPALASQVQMADQAYQAAMRNGAWEDARQRYQYLLEVDTMSVRILAKNRLEFIREWQQHPPVQTSALSPSQSSYTAPSNQTPWIPGDAAALRINSSRPAANTFGGPAIPAPTKDVVVRPTPPNNTTAQGTAPIKIPTYQDTQPAQPQIPQQPQSYQPPLQNQPAGVTAPRQPSPGTTTAAVRIKQMGKLNKAVPYQGTTQLYYLTNSQGNMTYYVKGTTATNSGLAGGVGRIVEIEGITVQTNIYGQLKPVITAEQVKVMN